MTTILELMHIMDEMHQYVRSKISFDQEGWPIFLREHFLDDWPENVVTFENRTSSLIASKSETVLCFYMGDIQNYRRFSHLQKDISIYQQYKGVVIPDITVTYDMDQELQEMTMLANQLFAAVLAVNGIKIVFNTRNGKGATVRRFKNIPRHVMCASGFLGCEKSSTEIAASPYINKILKLMPEKLIIYGKHDPVVDRQLDILGVNYRYYADFHRRSKDNEMVRRTIA